VEAGTKIPPFGGAGSADRQTGDQAGDQQVMLTGSADEDAAIELGT
jgi:hypothetical protein